MDTRAARTAADRFASNVMPIVREIQAGGARTLTAIADKLNALGIRTAGGGEWREHGENLLARL